MRCLECDTVLERIDNQHLVDCSGLTVQEYALKHHMPLDLILHPDQVNVAESPSVYGPGVRHVSEMARAVLEGLRMAGLVQEDGPYTVIPGDIRRLEQLLWDLEHLSEYGFQFRQDFSYSPDSHRVVAYNRLKLPTAKLRTRSGIPAHSAPPDVLDVLSVFVAHTAELQGGYLFLNFARSEDARCIAEYLRCEHEIRFEVLMGAELQGAGRLLRACRLEDTDRLLNLLRTRLDTIPCVKERFFDSSPVATVVKELVFDAAHFITDHPAKCRNLHGGRYLLHVKVRDRIDPITGCVVDFGYLKRVANRLVVDRFDHHNLNYSDPDLAWRSSTEMLCVHIWERLIQFLPALTELTLYETPQSWCNYTGPSLAEIQERGGSKLLTHFTDAGLGRAERRRLLAAAEQPMLHVIGQE